VAVQELVELEDQKAQLEKQAPVDLLQKFPAQLVYEALWDLLGQQALFQDHKEFEVKEEHLARQGRQVPQAKLAVVESKAFKVQ
tara:strand:- start:122 stop:373 length:252 start_codon:yes stop_codon:yes gene_type:complete